ncbi:MAG TPA: DUF378 domain-containing protein [Humisphaera sp.]|jgi:hypothetical protein|nr:DUF378 domain-containing protein [Humisphaera sp.]
MKVLDLTAMILVIVGALNWGLVGTAHFNLVTAIFGQTVLASTVFALVGAAGVFLAVRLAIAPKRVLWAQPA